VPRSIHPPAGISAQDFFESWLADAYLASGRRAPDDAPVVRVTLSGEGGGQWVIKVQDTDMTVLTGDAAPGGEAPGVWIRQKTADFLATFAGDPDLPQLFPDNFGPLDLLFLDPQDVDLIKQIDGRLALELTGRRRRRWGLDLAAGKNGLAAGRPRATVKLDAATYDGLRDKSIPPLKALLERRIVIDGDRALAMQALLLLGARLARS
jgi:hypothetical protein